MVAQRTTEQNPGPARACLRCGVYGESLQHQDESPGCNLSAGGTQRTLGDRKKKRFCFYFNTRERKLFKIC